MRKIVRLSAAFMAIVATGAFGGGGPRGEAPAPAGGGRGISGVMNDALQGAANSMRNALGLNDSQPLGTKLGAVRSNASYDGVGAIGGGVPDGGSDANGGIGSGVGKSTDPSDSDLGY